MAGFFGLIAVAVIRRHALCLGQTDWWIGGLVGWWVEKGRGSTKVFIWLVVLNMFYFHPYLGK